MKTIYRILGVAFIALLAAACNQPYQPAARGAQGGEKVLIRIASPDGRTILPAKPAFSGFSLTITPAAGGTASVDVANATGLDTEGYAVTLEAGEYTVAVGGKQVIDGTAVVVATGSVSLTVTAGQTPTAVVPLIPAAAIEAGAPEGVFSWGITLPAGTASATLTLQDGAGADVFEEVNLLTTGTGSRSLAAGYQRGRLC